MILTLYIIMYIIYDTMYIIMYIIYDTMYIIISLEKWLHVSKIRYNVTTVQLKVSEGRISDLKNEFLTEW